MPATSKTEQELGELIGSFYADPLGFVLTVFPWGREETFDGLPNPLKDRDGPEEWQRDLLIQLGQHIKDNMVRQQIGLEMVVWRSAVGTGHGVGKSATVAWLVLFLMSTRVDTRGVVTASTQFQIEDKTWPELAKWHNLMLHKHWFEWTSRAYTFAHYDEDQRKNYRTTAATVSKDNTEAFAGLHNEGKTVFEIFDEASGVHDKVWEVAEGALTDGEAFFFAMGNMTRPDGMFTECFGKYANMYRLWNVDSREVSHTNKNALNDIIKKYGYDSDEVKVRIRGMPPEQSFDGFINVSGVNEAINRELVPDHGAAKIMAVDVARGGRDETVIGMRQGRDYRSYKPRVFKGLKTTQVTERVAREADLYKPDVIVIESTGPGAGVIDQLRDRGYKVHEVHPGSQAVKFEWYANKRAECWAEMREWLYETGCIDDDTELFQQLTTILYTMVGGEQKIQLESKKDMALRGLPSPDRADTLALTFAVRIARRDRNLDQAAARRRRTAIMQDDPL